jgi:trehalose 6-phosphate phosphatase
VDDDAAVDVIASLAADPGAAALLFDVDGTLAPIVPRPEDARVPASTRAELERLAGRYGLVACVSGRPANEARSVVGVATLTYVGEHGLELDPEAEGWAGRIHAFARGTGRTVEQKPLTAAFHYRNAPDREAARRELEEVEAEARAAGFRTRWGRLVLELLPPVDTSKRTAVSRLLERSGLRRALYAGDDTTDLDAFAGLDDLELAVRVAVAAPESPAALSERADVVVGSPAELARLLAEL